MRYRIKRVQATEFEEWVNETIITLLIFVCLAMHLAEASMTAFAYAQMEVGENQPTVKWVLAGLACFIPFFGIAAISFVSALMLPTSLKNVISCFNKRNNVGALVESLVLFLFFLIVYLFAQYVFIIANLLLGNMIDAGATAHVHINKILWQSVKTVGESLPATPTQEKTTIISVFTIYSNIAFELLLSVILLSKSKESEKNNKAKAVSLPEIIKRTK